MASYNGSKYIHEQIVSILRQLSEDDELIVVDDCSFDSTIDVVKSFKDARIKIIINPKNLGVVRTFEIGINEARNNIIYLCDQDDIWAENKVQEINAIFEKKPEVSLVISNAAIIDKDGANSGELFYTYFNDRFFANLKSNNFLGCCIAFIRNRVGQAYPFPSDIPMHDYWIGLNHILYGNIHFIDKPLVKYRRHGENVTTGKRSNLRKVIKWRIILMRSLISRFLFSKKQIL